MTPDSTDNDSVSGGQLLAECLVLNNAQLGFGVPGESYLAVLDAMVDIQEPVSYTHLTLPTIYSV